jgi:hypothetical protein
MGWSSDSVGIRGRSYGATTRDAEQRPSDQEAENQEAENQEAENQEANSDRGRNQGPVEDEDST